MGFMKQNSQKLTLRTEAKRIRAGAAKICGLAAAEKASEHGVRLFSSFEKYAIVGAYWPIDDELDPRFLMNALMRAGYRTALPVVAAPNTPLAFRLWGAGDPLEAGVFGTHQPSAEAPEVIPHALIVPLLAYDADCYRLGWGGGFYDRTLAAHSEIKAFGFAYSAQIVDHVPRENHDWPLQGVITEDGIILPNKKTE